eukprot:1161444-Pelagomonas_calceolata.AAC.8
MAAVTWRIACAACHALPAAENAPLPAAENAPIPAEKEDAQPVTHLQPRIKKSAACHIPRAKSCPTG